MPYKLAENARNVVPQAFATIVISYSLMSSRAISTIGAKDARGRSSIPVAYACQIRGDIPYLQRLCSDI